MAVLVPGHEFLVVGVLAENRRRVDQDVRTDDIFNRVQDPRVSRQVANPLEAKMTLAFLLRSRFATETPVQLIMKAPVIAPPGLRSRPERKQQPIAAIGQQLIVRQNFRHFAKRGIAQISCSYSRMYDLHII